MRAGALGGGDGAGNDVHSVGGQPRDDRVAVKPGHKLARRHWAPTAPGRAR